MKFVVIVRQQKQMFDLENNKAMRHPYQIGTKVGTKVMLPTLNKIFALATEKYNAANGTNLDTTAEYNPYKLTSTVTQLALLPVTINGDVVEITPALEVINWQAARFAKFGEITVISSPIGLWHNSHLISSMLQHSSNDSSSKSWMINIGITTKDDNIQLIPSTQLYFLFSGWQI